jgi:hypothetical protein
VFLGTSTIFVQTIIQGFILSKYNVFRHIVILLILFYSWANDKHEKNQLRILLLNFAQGLILLQLTVTFVFQIAYVNAELAGYQSTFVWDMCGFLLHNLKPYQVKISFDVTLIGDPPSRDADIKYPGDSTLPRDTNEHFPQSRLHTH